MLECIQHMTPFALAGLLGGVSAFGFALFIYLEGPKRLLDRKLSIYMLSVSLWGFGALAIALAPTPPLAYLAWRLAFGLGVVWIALLFYDFTLAFCDLSQPGLLKVMYVFGVIFSAAAIFTPYFFSGVRFVFNQFYYGIPSWPLFGLFLVWWFGLVFYSHYLLIKAYPTATEPKKLQIWYFFIATAIGFTAGNLAYLPFFHIDLYPWGTFGVGLYGILMAYASIEHKLLDINLAVQRTLISSIIVTLIALALLASGFGAEWMSTYLGISPIVTAFVGSAVAFVLGNTVWQRSKRFEQLRYEFVTVAAHRLRTPITEILWGLDALQQESASQESKNNIVQVRASGNRLLALINQLLESVKTSDETLVYTLKACNLEALAGKVVAERSTQADRKHLHIFLRSELTEPFVRADEKRLSYVIEILIDNAILYTPDGGTIEVGITSHNVDYVMLRVRDTGIGIDKKEAEHLFSRLYRGSNALRIYTEGSGLGLFMAKEIISRHNGMIGAESDGENKGSTFWFILPKAKAAR